MSQTLQCFKLEIIFNLAITHFKIDIFDFKMTVKSGLEFFILSPFRVAAAQSKKICLERLKWQVSRYL